MQNDNLPEEDSWFDAVMHYISTLLAGVGLLFAVIALACFLGYFTSPSQI
jgi:hypothetical protein